VDLHVGVPRSLSSEKSHLIAEMIEARIEKIIPNSQALVHMDAFVTANESLHDRIRLIARNHAMTIHNIRVYQEKKHVSADLHLEVSDKLNLDQAHAEASKLEGFIRKELPDIRGVNIHIEGRRYEMGEGEDVTAQESQLVEAVRKVVAQFPEIINTHNIHIRRIDHTLSVYLHCAFAQQSTITRVHDISTEIEDLLKVVCPNVGRIMIHSEPQNAKR
jgi:divalent metal cation (Fe/Co/Zn/Cd) transporter